MSKLDGGKKKEKDRRTSIRDMMQDFQNPQQRLQQMFDQGSGQGQSRQRSASVINVRKTSVLLEGKSFLQSIMSPEDYNARVTGGEENDEIISLPFFKAKEVFIG